MALDPAWLRERIEAGASAADIAAEAGVTARTIRAALHRHGLPLPRDVRNASIDLDAVFGRAGEPVAHIARRWGVSPDWITSRVKRHRVQRAASWQRPRRRSKWPQLEDRRWILTQLAEGRTVHAIAKTLGTTRAVVKTALAAHGINPPPADVDPVERLAYIDDPAVVVATADRITTEAWSLAVRAGAVRDAALASVQTANRSRGRRSVTHPRRHPDQVWSSMLAVGALVRTDLIPFCAAAFVSYASPPAMI